MKLTLHLLPRSHVPPPGQPHGPVEHDDGPGGVGGDDLAVLLRLVGDRGDAGGGDVTRDGARPRVGDVVDRGVEARGARGDGGVAGADALVVAVEAADEVDVVVGELEGLPGFVGGEPVACCCEGAFGVSRQFSFDIYIGVEWVESSKGSGG